MTVRGSIQISNNMTVDAPASVPGAQPLATAASWRFVVVPGTAADQADVFYARVLSLAAAPQTLDLTALLDPFGAAISLARVRSISILNSSIASPVLVGFAAATANAWTGFLANPGQLVVQPSTATNQGILTALAPGSTGWPVSAASKLLQLDPGAATVSVSVTILGASV